MSNAFNGCILYVEQSIEMVLSAVRKIPYM